MTRESSESGTPFTSWVTSFWETVLRRLRFQWRDTIRLPMGSVVPEDEAAGPACVPAYRGWVPIDQGLQEDLAVAVVAVRMQGELQVGACRAATVDSMTARHRLDLDSRNLRIANHLHELNLEVAIVHRNGKWALDPGRSGHVT